MILQLNVFEPAFNVLSRVFFKVVIAIIIFLFGFIFGKLAGRVVYRALKETEINKLLNKSVGIKLNVDSLLSNIISYAIYFLAVVGALDQLGVANVILYLLSAALIIVILISFFLAIRDMLPNLISGLYLYGKDIAKENSKIELNGIKGKVIKVDILHVKIKTKNGDILYVPNSVVAKSKVKIKT